jgi:predicted ATPase/DNA-binding winged helix-turn-helix (wHTH) protein
MPTTIDTYRFGQFDLQPRERRLLEHGSPVTVHPRAFDLLVALVERAGHLASKDELLIAVWRGLVVEENNLQVQISALRKILGSDAIATIPGLGYRFVLDVDAVLADSARASAVSPPISVESMTARDHYFEHLAALLRQHRLVTMLGAPGVGKTTLARAVAQEAVEQTPIVAWVELAPLMDPTLIPSAIARALQLPLAGSDAESDLLRAVRPLDALVVLDNAEHLIEPLTRFVPPLLASGTGLRVLVTSQAPLKIDREWLFRLEPLSCPPANASPDHACTYGAMALFIAQAHAAGYRFVLDEHNVGAVIDICRQLDGVALAIKLAAARLPLLGLAGLQTGLVQSLKILGGGGRDALGRRHETLRASFDWSHDLLAPPERVVFRRLGVFVGGFTLETACAVGTDERLNEVDVIDALAALVDRSFVVVDTDAQPRYHLLQTAREYSLLQLERSGESLDIGRRHAHAMLTLLEQAYDVMWQQADDRVYESCVSELDNVRAAVSWSITNDAALAVRLGGELRQLFLYAGRQHEMRALSERIEPLVTEATAAGFAAWFWILRGLALLADDREQSAAATLRGVELFRKGGDLRKRTVALLAAISATSLSLEAKEGLLLELRQAIPPHWPAHRRTLPLGVAEAAVAWLRGDCLAARDAYLQAVTIIQSSPGLRGWRGELLHELANKEQVLGLLDDALEHAREAVALARERGPSNLLANLPLLAGVLMERGEVGDARKTLVEAAALSRRAGWSRMGVIARRFVCLADREGRIAEAARLLGYLRRLNIRLDPLAQATEAHIQSLGEAMTGAALAPEELARYMAEGAMLDEAAVCELGLSKPAVANDGV